MEMHQIRYFLAVSRTLNFTRAAEQCNVAQPSLTRAIKLLEEELGADLFRREGRLTHLTDFGQRMLPLLQQCFDSAVTAKSLAKSLKTGAVAPLNVALSNAVDMAILVEALKELTRVFPGLELQFRRGTGDEIADGLKKGDIEIAIAGAFDQSWSRLDAWPLFSERFSIVVNATHRLATETRVDMDSLRGEHFLQRPYCDRKDQIADALGAADRASRSHQVASDDDLMRIVEADLGIALVPASTRCPAPLRKMPVAGLDIERTVSVYAVSGRPHSASGAALVNLLRSADWRGPPS
jgi:DNA-binding transcriptional LysR family regulator